MHLARRRERSAIWPPLFIIGENMKSVFVILNLFFAPSVLAFTLVHPSAPRFSESTVYVDLAASNCSGTGRSLDEIRSLILESNRMYWNSVSMSSIELKFGSITSDDFSNAPDMNAIVSQAGVNRILATCNEDIFAPANMEGVGGQGSIACSGGSCRGALALNAHGSSNLPQLSALEMKALIGHEIGHALGLGHTEVKEALMHYSIGNKSQESLHMDDMLGIAYLYPQDKKVGGLLGACGTIALIGNNSNPPAGGAGGLGVLSFVFILGLLLIRRMPLWLK